MNRKGFNPVGLIIGLVVGIALVILLDNILLCGAIGLALGLILVKLTNEKLDDNDNDNIGGV